MEDNTKIPVAVKKEYEKPVLRVIDLAAEEILAIGCKMFTGGPAFERATACGITNNCSANGS